MRTSLMFLILLDAKVICELEICKMYFTYITTNPGKNALYVGMTNNLKRRIWEHEANRGKPETFAGRYYCYKLVYFETFKTPMEAIVREDEIKDMSRDEKIKLIKSKNPGMNFLIP
ncbi:MAG TPA: GIY-YIG nuclease family protein [Bacteroidia bacterium]|nr:GIY-YIG nuclease family protein [Bacteroidia bacterium]